MMVPLEILGQGLYPCRCGADSPIQKHNKMVIFAQLGVFVLFYDLSLDAIGLKKSNSLSGIQATRMDGIGIHNKPLSAMLKLERI